MMVYDDERETRAEVCEECDHLLRAMPLTCLLVKRQKQIGPMPCPHALRDMLYDANADCPHPDTEWAARWKSAGVLLESANAEKTSVSLTSTLTTSTQAADSSCAAKSSQREVNPEAINHRARERRTQQRGVNHKAIYVHKHPTRSVADT